MAPDQQRQSRPHPLDAGLTWQVTSIPNMTGLNKISCKARLQIFAEISINHPGAVIKGSCIHARFS